MKKKFLIATVPALAVASLGIAGVVGVDNGYATDDITDGDALRTCLQTVAQSECKLGGDVTLDASTWKWGDTDYYNTQAHVSSVDINGGHNVKVDMNGYNIDVKIPINIKNGNLSFVNDSAEGGKINFVANYDLPIWQQSAKQSFKPQFNIAGSSDKTSSAYSVLELGQNIQVSNIDNSAIVINTSANNQDQFHGIVVTANSTNIDAPTAITVNRRNASGFGLDYTQNIPTITIFNGSNITTTDQAFVIDEDSAWRIDDTAVNSKDDVFKMTKGTVSISVEGADTNIATDGEGSAIFDVNQFQYSQVSIDIKDGVFQSADAFYRESFSKNNQKTSKLSISGGTYTANDLFDVYDAGQGYASFAETHKGFITGGTWGPEWDEMNDNIFVASDYLKDFDESMGEFSNVMTVTQQPNIEGLPDGYTLDLSRKAINDDEILKLILEKAGVQGTALNQYIEAYLRDGTGIQVTELPDGSEGITLRIGGFEGIPERKEGVIREYYIISIHDSGDPENPEFIVTKTTYDEGTNEVVFPNLKKFSNFIVAYKDTENGEIIINPTEEAKTPDTGAGSIQEKVDSAVTTSAILAFIAAGAAISTFFGLKLYRKKHQK